MKKLIVFTVVIFALSLSSCLPKDKCASRICQNGGACSDGTCSCTEAYEGDNCETPRANKFVGTWNGSTNCGTVKSLRITWKADLTLQCDALSSNGTLVATFYATIAPNRFQGVADITRQDVNGLSIQGFLDMQDALNLTWVNGNCTVRMVKQ
jgi:hypothetical protein